MDTFENQLKTLVKFAQDHLMPGSFAIYQPPFVTIGYFDGNGDLHVLADDRTCGDLTTTFNRLLSQLHKRARERALSCEM